MSKMSRRAFLKKATVAGALALGNGTFLSACEGPFFNTGTKKTLNFWAFSDTRIAWQKKGWELYKRQKRPDFEISWLVLPYQQMVLVTALNDAQNQAKSIIDFEVA